MICGKAKDALQMKDILFFCYLIFLLLNIFVKNIIEKVLDIACGSILIHSYILY